MTIKASVTQPSARTVRAALLSDEPAVEPPRGAVERVSIAFRRAPESWDTDYYQLHRAQT